MWTLTTSRYADDVTSVNILYHRAVSTSGQPYHHGNLRPVLVDTAVELARTTGPDGVVLREVARRAGVSHNAAYRHFSDRAALLSEVSDCAMADLEVAMRTRIDAVTLTDPTARAVERLRETGRAYVAFALREPGLFAVAFTVHDGACWATVHGFADLSVHGPLRDVPAEMRDPLLETVLDVVHRGLLG